MGIAGRRHTPRGEVLLWDTFSQSARRDDVQNSFSLSLSLSLMTIRFSLPVKGIEGEGEGVNLLSNWTIFITRW